MFKESYTFFAFIVSLFLAPISVKALAPLAPLPIVNFFPTLWIPILARLRNNKRIADLMQKVQKASQNKQANPTSPLTDAETKEIEEAIRAMYQKTYDDLKAIIQEIANSRKSIIHFKVETDMQIAPGLPMFIEMVVTPEGKILTTEEAKFVEIYTATLNDLQNKFKDLMSRILKDIPQAVANPTAIKR